VNPVADVEGGRAGSAPPPPHLYDGLMPSLTVTLANANFHRSTVNHGTVLGIFKIIATSNFLTALKCTKFVLGRGSAPDYNGGALSAPPDHLSGLRGSISKEEGRGGRQEMERRRGDE